MPVDVLASDVAEQTLVADLCQLYAREVTRDQYTKAQKGLAPFSLKLKRYAKQCVYGKDKALTPEELEEAIEDELVKRLGPDARVNLDPPRAGRSALVLDGGAVRVLFAAGPALEVILFRLLAQYKAVLACRVTPKQKAQFVKLVLTQRLFPNVSELQVASTASTRYRTAVAPSTRPRESLRVSVS